MLCPITSEDLHELGPGNNNVVHTLFMKSQESPDLDRQEKMLKVQLTFSQLAAVKIDPTYKVVMFYNMACCYQRLQLYDECAEYLEKSTHSLKERILLLDQHEQNFLLNKRKMGQMAENAMKTARESFKDKFFNATQRFETVGNFSNEKKIELTHYLNNGKHALTGHQIINLKSINSRSKTRQANKEGFGLHGLTQIDGSGFNPSQIMQITTDIENSISNDRENHFQNELYENILAQKMQSLRHLCKLHL